MTKHRSEAADTTLETQVLAAALHYPDHREVCVEALSAADFVGARNTAVFLAISKLHREAGHKFDLLSFLSAGGEHASTFVEEQHYTSATSLEEYEGAIDRLRLLSTVRRIAQCAAEVAVCGVSAEATADPSVYIANATRRLTDALGSQRSRVEPRLFGDVILPIVSDMVEGRAWTPRIVAPSGIEAVDKTMVWGGFGSGELSVVIGRPGMGKTAFGLQVARTNAVAGLHTAFLSFETSAEDLALSVLAGDARIALRAMVGRVSQDIAQAANMRAEKLSGIPLHILDCPGLKFEEMVLALRAMRRKGNLDLIVIDYLQKLSMARRYNARHEEVGDIASGLKQLARELDVPVVALAQPNRESDKRADKRPTMADIGQSGQIEQDADRIIGLFRECQYDATKDEHAAEALFLKNRKGRVGMIPMHFDGATGTFSGVRGGWK